jgi:hypothetical protein
MNSYQELWWRQARSDYEMFSLCRSNGVPPCHALHYLQMSTEKLNKAYRWRSGDAPPRSHAGLVYLLRFLGQARTPDQDRIAGVFAFKRYVDFQNWIRVVMPIAYELERLAPALAAGGPNPEYPWPPDRPTTAPADYAFPVWTSLSSTGAGRDLMRMIHTSMIRFPEYAGI